MEKLVSYHSCPYNNNNNNDDKLGNLKINNFSWNHQKTELKDKQPPRNIKEQAHTHTVAARTAYLEQKPREP